MKMARHAARVLDRLTVKRGRLIRGANDHWVLTCGGGIGRVFVGGRLVAVPPKPTSNAQHKWCLRVFFDGRDCEWVNWNMEWPQPSDSELFDPDYTYGDIHVPRVP